MSIQNNKKAKVLKIELSKWARNECEEKELITFNGPIRLCNDQNSMCCLGHLEHKLNKQSLKHLKCADSPATYYCRTNTVWESDAIDLNDLLAFNLGEYSPKKQKRALIKHFKQRPEEEGGPIELVFIDE